MGAIEGMRMDQLEIYSESVQNESAERPLEKAAIPQKPKRVLDGPTSLYKYYSKEKRLLYVGISLSALQRLAQHRRTSAWFDQVHMVIIQKYKTRKAALAAEKKLIQAKNPAYNEHHSPNWIGRHIVKKFGCYDNWVRYTDFLRTGLSAPDAYKKAMEAAPPSTP
jgi:predicted GIY-YIG superfamily endonuclease